MNSFRRPVLSSAISYHCVPSAAPARGSSAHSSATLRAEKKRRLESARMLGATRRSGYPSDSSRRRRSQRVVGLTATSTRRPAALIGPGPGAALPSRPDGASAGDCPPPPPARAGERQCPPARTVQAAGDSDRVRPRLDDNPPPSSARAGSDVVLPPGRCKPQVSRTAGRRRRTRRPHRYGPGAGSATPPGRCPAMRATRVPRSGRRRRPAALISPGRGATLSSRPDGASHR